MGSEVHRRAAVQIGHKEEQGSKGDQQFQKREECLSASFLVFLGLLGCFADECLRTAEGLALLVRLLSLLWGCDRRLSGVMLNAVKSVQWL